jgi:hypothetical protein
VLGQLYGARTALLALAIVSMFTFLPVFLSPLRGMRTLPQQPEDPDTADAAGDSPDGPDDSDADRTLTPA